MAAQPTARSDGENGVVLRHLVFGDVAHQYSVEPHPGIPMLVVGLAGEPGEEARAMEFVRAAQTAAHRVTVIGGDGSERSAAQPVEPLPSWASTGFAPAFEHYLRASFGAGADGLDELRDLTPLGPLMLLRTHQGAHPYTEVLMCARVRAVGTLFARVGRFDHASESGIAELVSQALSFTDSLRDRVRIEGNAYVTYEQGIEIEQKINLFKAPSIWSVTRGLWAAVENGEFPGFITDPGYELTRWHFVQHNFEILGPAGEVGHMAFQELPDEKYQLKRKRFPKDSLRREETFRKGIEVPAKDFEGFLSAEYPELNFRRLPSFLRTRFDINVQSVITGHYFGIETDEVNVVTDSRPARLRQVEMEYLETRWHEGMDGASIDADLDRLTGLVEKHLAKAGVAAERSFYSKLSFLRDYMDGTGAEQAFS
ncbi:hypothetical protein ACFYPA_32615 [Streptomyces sp. NPDC005775]|uniref:hypothetical protein n=1 Tax=Streptomyces sp. NPDC005775 TaxID=3364729 RepID=UPI0036B358E5